MIILSEFCCGGRITAPAACTNEAASRSLPIVSPEHLCRGLQINMESMPAGGVNAHGNGFWCNETAFATEAQAQRLTHPATARAWKISNPAVKHPVTGEATHG